MDRKLKNLRTAARNHAGPQRTALRSGGERNSELSQSLALQRPQAQLYNEGGSDKHRYRSCIVIELILVLVI